MDAPRLTRRQVVSLSAGTLLGAIDPRPALARSVNGPAAESNHRATLRSLAIPQPRAQAPASPVGEQLAWVVEQIGGEARSLRMSVLEERFTEEFLEALPVKELLDTFRELARSLPEVALARFEGTVTETHAVAIVTTDAIDDWRISIGVEEATPHRIESLFMSPVPYPAPLVEPPEDWDAFDDWLAGIAPRAGFQAVELDGDEPRAIHGYEANEPLAIGSAFKLFVLDELARQIEAGEIGWDERLEIRDELRSLPSGDMRLLPAGTSRSVRTFAERMITDSDNTATDHLIARLGRERVESGLEELGHGAPSLLRPLLLTREWFAFKLRLRFDDVLTYLASDVAARRAYLADVVAPLADELSEEESVAWTRPRQIETVEWFASPADLCRAVASLDRRAAAPALAPLPELLSAVPGVVFDARVWSYVGYKGGYETGVLSHCWLLERGDGRRFALTALINDPWQEIDGLTLTRLMIPAASLLADEP
jgi:hypothetical protein